MFDPRSVDKGDIGIVALVSEEPLMEEERFRGFMDLVKDPEIRAMCLAMRDIAADQPGTGEYTPSQFKNAKQLLELMKNPIRQSSRRCPSCGCGRHHE